MLVNFNFAKHVNVIKITLKKGYPQTKKKFSQSKYKGYKAEQTN